MIKEVSPQFKFYAQDFLTGCTYLTNEEVGMYIKMLCKQWTDGSVPKKRVGFLLGCEWDSVSDELRSKFNDDGKTLINERLEIERLKKQEYLDKQRENGKKGGRPKEPKKNPRGIPEKTQGVSQKKPYQNDNDNSLNKYEAKDFLSDWNELRTEYLKRPSFVKRLQPYEISDFRNLANDYSRDDFRNALIGLFKQRKLPNGTNQMQSNPSHFLGKFNSYLTAFHDKDNSLYGKPEKETNL